MKVESPYLIEARKMGELIIEKQAAYGDSFGKSGDVMRILYPNGISLEQMDDALTVIRCLDKFFRVATKKNAFGESPWKDVMGYALLSVVKDLKNNPLVKAGLQVRGSVNAVKRPVASKGSARKLRSRKS